MVVPPGHGSRLTYNLANQLVRTRQVDVLDGASAPLLCVELSRVGAPGDLLGASATVALQQLEPSGEDLPDWAPVRPSLLGARADSPG